MAGKKWKREGWGVTAIVMPQLRRGAQVATDKATTYAFQSTTSKIVSVGLGRLSKAVGSTSSLKRGRTSTNGEAWGAIFAKGKADTRGNQALLAYSEGAAIFPTGGRKWLAFATKAIPSKGAKNRKMTPELYNSSALVDSIGKLHFVQVSSKLAVLVARKVTVSRKTGRAKAFTGRVPRGADAQDSVVAFVLIRWTRRAQRFSQAAIMQDAANQIGRFLLEYQETHSSSG